MLKHVISVDIIEDIFGMNSKVNVWFVILLEKRMKLEWCGQKLLLLFYGGKISILKIK